MCNQPNDFFLESLWSLEKKRELDEKETEEGTKPTKKPKVEEKEAGEQQSVYKSGVPLILDLTLTFSYKNM